jgi:shikimate kinase
VSRNARRPLLQTEDPLGTMRALLASRRGAYEEAAEWVIDTSGLSQAEAAERIIAEARRVFSWHHAE